VYRVTQHIITDFRPVLSPRQRHRVRARVLLDTFDVVRDDARRSAPRFIAPRQPEMPRAFDTRISPILFSIDFIIAPAFGARRALWKIDARYQRCGVRSGVADVYRYRHYRA